MSHRMEQLRRRAAVALVPVMALLSAGGAEAQTAVRPTPTPTASSFLGYAGNFPSQEIGFTYGRIRDRRWGLYLDVKVSVGVPGRASRDYFEDVTVPIAEALGHTRLDEKTGYFSFNVGTTRRLGRRVAAYGGLGLCGVQPFRKYHDPSLLFGTDGEYWIDGAEQDVRPNLFLGTLFTISPRILAQVGVETLPAGLTLGLAWLVQGAEAGGGP